MEARALELELARPRLPGLVAAAYDGRSIGSILPTVLGALGAKPPASLLPPLRDVPPALLEGVERVILLTLDGWGWRQLQNGLQGGWARLAGAGHLVPITSVSPATTSSALATLNTGLAPADHGLLGYHLWLREFGCVANMVSFAPAVGGRSLDAHVRPEDFFRHPTASTLLRAAGAWHLNVTRREFVGSALTRMLYQDAEHVGTATLGELLVELRNGLDAMRGGKGLLQGYWPAIDTVAHARGPGSPHHAAELALLGDALARELLDKARDPAALLLVTADHGLVTVPPEQVMRVRDQPWADALLLPPWGDSRWAFLQPREGRGGEVRDALRAAWGGEGLVLDAAEVERLRLLGPHPWPARTRERAGAMVALPPPGRGLAWPYHAERAWPPRDDLLGRHGGATPEEMLVPLLAVRLGRA